MRDGFALRQNFSQIFGTQHVTQSSGRQQTGRVAVGVYNNNIKRRIGKKSGSLKRNIGMVEREGKRF
jgi:hypothetical protein